MAFKQMILVILACLPIISSQTFCTRTRDIRSRVFQQQASSLNFKQCQDLCFTRNNCRFGFDWIYIPISNNPRCFLSLTPITDSASGFEHYNCTSLTVGTTRMTSPAVVTTNVVTPTGGPRYIWTKMANSNSPGGRRTQYTTLAACQQACLMARTTNCRFGIDFNTNNQCFFSVDATVNKGTADGVDHYVFMMVEPTPECTFVELKNRSSPGGILITTATDLNKCKEACKQRDSCELGFDFNPMRPAGSQCYISTTNRLVSDPGVSHYRAICRRPCVWTRTMDKNSPGGMSQSSFNTLKACQDGCLASSETESCKYGIDFQPSLGEGFRCWFSKSGVLTSFPGVNHYNPACDSRTACKFEKQMNKNSPGGVAQSLLNTVDECKLRCRINNETDCKYGFDYVPSNGIGARCWFSRNRNIRDAEGVNHYVYKCTSIGVTTAVPGGCRFVKKPGKNTRNAISQTSLNTLEACKQRCLTQKDNDCRFGFDWNNAAQNDFKCWFSRNNALNDYSAVDHYDIVCDGGEQCVFTAVANKNARGGTSKNFNSLIDCKNGCKAVRTTDCRYGFDWDPNGSDNLKCWFSVTATLSDSFGVTHYNLNCDGGRTTGGMGGTTMVPVTGQQEYVFDVQRGRNSPNGARQANANTLEECKRRCIVAVETTCKYGFDYNAGSANGQKCWFSTVATLLSAPGIDHYTPRRVEQCIWSRQNNTNTANGVKQNGISSVRACQNRCAAMRTTNCTYGFDYDTTNNMCFFSTTAVLNTGATGVDHYTCNSSGSATTTPGFQQTTTIPRICTRWILQQGKNSPGGEVKDFNTLVACQNACAAQRPAVGNAKPCPNGIDFDDSKSNGSKCYFSRNSAVADSPGVNHYTCDQFIR